MLILGHNSSQATKTGYYRRPGKKEKKKKKKRKKKKKGNNNNNNTHTKKQNKKDRRCQIVIKFPVLNVGTLRVDSVYDSVDYV